MKTLEMTVIGDLHCPLNPRAIPSQSLIRARNPGRGGDKEDTCDGRTDIRRVKEASLGVTTGWYGEIGEK